MRSRRGLTLAELIFAMALSSVVFAAIVALASMAVRHQVRAAGDQTAALAIALAVAGIERELCVATVLNEPSPGMPSGTAAGCSNAAAPPAGGPLAPIDATRPMRGFAVCQTNGVIYLHAEDGACPLGYVCGDGGMPLAGRPSGGLSASAAFSRPWAFSPLIEGRVTVLSSGESRSADIACSMSVAAGRNQ